MVGRKNTTSTAFYFPPLKLVCILLKIEVYNAGWTTRGGIHSPNFFLQKVYFTIEPRNLLLQK